MTKGYRRLQEVTKNTKYYKDVILQGVTRAYKRLQEVTAGYKGLQRVTSGYRVLQGLKRVRGG